MAASGLPIDWALFNVKGDTGENRDMTREALEIILRLWSDEDEFDYRGTYWHVTKGAEMYGFLRPHLKPLQQPHPPIGVAGLSSGSDTLKLAGEHGFIPMSLNPEPGLRRQPLGGGRGGCAPDGADGRPRVVANGARGLRRGDRRGGPEALGGRNDGAHDGGVLVLLPLLAQFGFTEYLKHTPDVPDSDVTPEYCAEKNWLIGSPSTVVEKLQACTRRWAGSERCSSSGSTIKITRRPGTPRWGS